MVSLLKDLPGEIRIQFFCTVYRDIFESLSIDVSFLPKAQNWFVYVVSCLWV